MKNANCETDPKEISDKLDAILAVLILGLSPEQTEKGRKTEQILAHCGLSNDCIGRVLGKNRDAIRMALTRARKK